MLLTLIASALASNVACPAGPEPLAIIVSDMKPMVMQTAESAWTGFDAELWEAIAEEIDCPDYEITVTPFAEQLNSLATDGFDVGLGGITITGDREELVDFTHSYMNTGIGIMVRSEADLGFVEYMSALWDSPFGAHVVWLLVYVGIMAHVVWFADRGYADNINDKYWPGISEAAYFVCTTMTTVGYGDISAKTNLMRVIVVCGVMFPGIGLGGIVIGDIVSFAVNGVSSYDINNASELRGKKVATVDGTTSIEALAGYTSKVTRADTVEAAAELLLSKEVDAVVFDQPSLQYYAHHDGNGKVVVLDDRLTEENYGFALPEDTMLREPINRAVFKLKENGVFDGLERKYFGG